MPYFSVLDILLATAVAMMFGNAYSDHLDCSLWGLSKKAVKEKGKYHPVAWRDRVS